MSSLHRRAFLRRGLGAAAGLTFSLPRPRLSEVGIAGPPPSRSAATLQAVSLLQLARQAQRGGRALPTSVATLSGLTQVRGYVSAPGPEIILYGDRGTGPALHIDDVAVALRNRYAPPQHPLYGVPPGCTIDPRPGADDPWALQAARVLGLPDCRMALRMLTHDYSLKRIGGGLDAHASIASSFDVARKDLASCAANGGRAQSLVHRFWFVPKNGASPRFTVADASVSIDHPVGVQLLTEREFLRDGERVGSAPASPLASRWAGEVSAALERGTFAADMVSDFRLIELATVMRFLDVPTSAIRYWLEEHAPTQVTVPRWYGGVRRTEEGELTCRVDVNESRRGDELMVSATQAISAYRLEYRGGVEADVKVAGGDVRPSRDGRLGSLLGGILASRPSVETAAWPFST